MYIKKIIILIIVFSLGHMSNNLLHLESHQAHLNIQNDIHHTLHSVEEFNIKTNTVEQQFNNLKNFFNLQETQSSTLKDQPSPKERIDMSHIEVLENEVKLDISQPQWAIFTDSKSMDPVIDSNTKAIQIIPDSPQDIQIGDIVAYESEFRSGVIAHRVVEISEDKHGWYARLKGDNNDQIDPGKIRFHQIKRVVVAIIY